MKIVVCDSRLTASVEHRSWAETLAICARVPVGSLSEMPHEAGLTHFIEHLALKATAGRSPKDQRLTLSRLGGAFNGETGVDYLSYYCRVDPGKAQDATELLSQMLFVPEINSALIETEKNVILSEIQAHRSNMMSLLYELIAGTIYPDHPISRPVTGSKDSLAALTEHDVRRFHDHKVATAPVWLGFVGNIADEEVASLCQLPLLAQHLRAPSLTATEPTFDDVPDWRVVDQDLKWPVPNTYVIFILRATPKSDPRYCLVTLFTSIVRNLHGSPLYAVLRSENGNLYNLDVFLTANSFAGHIGIVIPLNRQTDVRTADLLASFKAFFDTLTLEDFDRYVASWSLQLRAAGENSLLRAQKLCEDMQYCGGLNPISTWEQTVREYGLQAFQHFVLSMFEEGVSTITITNP